MIVVTTSPYQFQNSVISIYLKEISGGESFTRWLVGTKGAKHGARGARGARGAKGVKGVRGARGAKGAKGARL